MSNYSLHISTTLLLLLHLLPFIASKSQWYAIALNRLYQSRTSKNFRFIQIGAYTGQTRNDPIFYKVLEQQWKGILIEPVPSIFEKLQQNYADWSYPNGHYRQYNAATHLSFENSAICNSNQQNSSFYRLSPLVLDEIVNVLVGSTERTAQWITRRKNVPNWSEQASSLMHDQILKILTTSFGLNNKQAKFIAFKSRIEIPCITYEALLEKYHLQLATKEDIVQIDYVHIDAEGYDWDIVKAITSLASRSTAKYPIPKILCYESLHIHARENENQNQRGPGSIDPSTSKSTSTSRKEKEHWLYTKHKYVCEDVNDGDDTCCFQTSMIGTLLPSPFPLLTKQFSPNLKLIVNSINNVFYMNKQHDLNENIFKINIIYPSKTHVHHPPFSNYFYINDEDETTMTADLLVCVRSNDNIHNDICSSLSTFHYPLNILSKEGFGLHHLTVYLTTASGKPQDQVDIKLQIADSPNTIKTTIELIHPINNMVSNNGDMKVEIHVVSWPIYGSTCIQIKRSQDMNFSEAPCNKNSIRKYIKGLPVGTYDIQVVVKNQVGEILDTTETVVFDMVDTNINAGTKIIPIPPTPPTPPTPTTPPTPPTPLTPPTPPTPPTPLRVSNVFGSQMVLQRLQPVPIWGWCEPNTRILVQLDHQKQSTTSNTNGFWKVILPKQQGSLISHNIKINNVDSGEQVMLLDVLFGEVILFSGQSNMEFVVPASKNATEEIAAADNFPFIRLFDGGRYPELILTAPYLFNQTHHELLSTNLKWTVASSKSIGGCPTNQTECDKCCGNPIPGVDHKGSYASAIGWYTSRDLFLTLNSSIPIGCIVQTYGGTSIQHWMSKKALVDSNAPSGSQCCEQGGEDSCLWNTQIHPYTLGPTKFRSVIWYQGEQNGNAGGPYQSQYSNMLQALVHDWRKQLQQPTLLFGGITLAPWHNHKDTTSFPLIRLAQINLTKYVKNTFLINSLDCGDKDMVGQLHSPYKQMLGRRAANGIAAVSGLVPSISYLGPMYKNASVVSKVEGDGIIVAVTFQEEGLYNGSLVIDGSVSCPVRANGDCSGFEIMDDQYQWKKVTSAVVFPSVLELKVGGWSMERKAMATRSLFAGWPVMNVYNEDGVPMVPWWELLN